MAVGFGIDVVQVGMDLFLTDTKTSEVIGHSSVFKQVVADEIGANIGRFFGNILVSVDMGQQNREAVHFALRNMLKMAVYEMLADLYDIDSKSCGSIIEKVEGVHDGRSPAPLATEVMVEPFDGEEEWQKVSY